MPLDSNVELFVSKHAQPKLFLPKRIKSIETLHLLGSTFLRAIT
ncbi:hypothetical protein [Cyanobacterium sp. uoEpiScrs1]|nr:hypothetical protein [Cyanobacterium sp. uoEpiScrs1]